MDVRYVTDIHFFLFSPILIYHLYGSLLYPHLAQLSG